MAGPPNMGPPPPNVDHGPGLLAVGWIEAALGMSMLALRMYTRGRIVKSVGWDDWIMAFAAILALVTTILVTLEVHFGVGRHVEYLTPYQLQKALEMVWLTQPFSTMSACFGKISIALLLMRLMAKNRWREGFLWFIIVTLFLVNLGLTIITFSQCTPVTYLWTQFTPGSQGHCWNPKIQMDFGTFQGSYSAFTDFVLAVFPLSFLWTLQVNLRLKIGLAVLLGLGIIATVAASIKTANLHELANPDFTFAPIDLIYWYLTENWIIIICGCAPTLPPLFSRKWGAKSSQDTPSTDANPHASYTSDRSDKPFRLHRPITSVGSEDDWDLEKGGDDTPKSSGSRSDSPQVPEMAALR